MTKPLSASGPQRPRIILVDDDALVLRSLVRVLRREFDVVTASTAEAAIAKLVDDIYAVITDHDLGAGPDGRAVLAEARLRVPSARRILTSGERRTPREGEAALWHAMILKPISRDKLFSALGIRGTK